MWIDRDINILEFRCSLKKRRKLCVESTGNYGKEGMKIFVNTDYPSPPLVMDPNVLADTGNLKHLPKKNR